MEYLARVAVNPYTIAWDQSMFFMEMLLPQLVDPEKPFAFPKEVHEGSVCSAVVNVTSAS